MAATSNPATPAELSAELNTVGEAKIPLDGSAGSEREAAMVEAALVLAATTSTETTTLPGATVTLTASTPTPAAVATTDAMAVRRAGV